MPPTRPSPNLLLLPFLLLLLSLLPPPTTQQPFHATPTIKIPLTTPTLNPSPSSSSPTTPTLPTSLSIDLSNEHIMAIGFTDGNIRVYNMLGQNLYTMPGLSTSVQSVSYVMVRGWTGFDDSGNAGFWGITGELQKQWLFNQTIKDMGLSFYLDQQQGDVEDAFIFNFGTGVVKSPMDGDSTDVVESWNVEKGEIFEKMGSYYDGQFVAMGMGTSQAKFYDHFGELMTTLPTTGPVIDINFPQNDNDGDILLTKDGMIYRYSIIQDDTGNISVISVNFTLQNPASMVSVCANNNYVVAAQGKSIGVYDYFEGKLLQRLDYLSGKIVAIQCSLYFLVTLDQEGYLTVNTIDAGPHPTPSPPKTNSTPHNKTIDQKLPLWFYILLISCGAFLLITAPIIFCYIRKRKNYLETIGSYNKMDNQQEDRHDQSYISQDGIYDQPIN